MFDWMLFLTLVHYFKSSKEFNDPMNEVGKQNEMYVRADPSKEEEDDNDLFYVQEKLKTAHELFYSTPKEGRDIKVCFQLEISITYPKNYYLMLS